MTAELRKRTQGLRGEGWPSAEKSTIQITPLVRERMGCLQIISEAGPKVEKKLETDKLCLKCLLFKFFGHTALLVGS